MIIVDDQCVEDEEDLVLMPSAEADTASFMNLRFFDWESSGHLSFSRAYYGSDVLGCDVGAGRCVPFHRPDGVDAFPLMEIS